MRTLRVPFSSRPVAVLLGALGVCHAAYALDEDIFFTEVPTVYSASRMPQVMSEAPSFMTVIDREMIRASGARAVSDLMRLVPGFQVTSRNLEMPARVTYHGLSSEDYSPRLQVLVDGRSQYSPLFQGGVNWDLLPVAIEDIERIEVVRGSNVAAYGTNAFMGVVNIITTDASQVQGATVSMARGSNGTQDEFLRLGGKVNDSSFRISYQQQADDGIRYKPSDLSKDPTEVANGQKKRLLDLRTDISLTNFDELSIGLGKIEGNMQVGQMPVGANETHRSLNFPRSIYQSSQYVQLGWRRMLRGGDELNIRFNRTEDRLIDQFVTDLSVQFAAIGGIAGDTLNYGGETQRQEWELQHLIQASASTRIIWGGGSRDEKVTSPFNFYNVKAARTVDRAFGHLEWRPAQDWLINLGASSDTDSLTGNRFSPRTSVSYRFSDAHTFRAGVARSFRIPSMFERLGYQYYGATGINPKNQTKFISDQAIQPEELLSQEIGYYGELKELRTTIDIRAFDEHLPNLSQVIPSKRTDGVWNPNPDYAINAQDVRITGFEYQIRLKPVENTTLIFGQTSGQISVNQLNVLNNDQDRVNKLATATAGSMPQMTTNLMLMQKLPKGLDFTILLNQQGQMKWTPNHTIPGYTRVDWRLAKSFKVGSKVAEAAYVVQSEQGDHLELNKTSITGSRQWVTLRLEL